MDANQIIDALGGTNETARIFEIEPPSVSEWRKNNRIPKARLQTIRLMRPDLFKQRSAKRKAS